METTLLVWAKLVRSQIKITKRRLTGRCHSSSGCEMTNRHVSALQICILWLAWDSSRVMHFVLWRDSRERRGNKWMKVGEVSAMDVCEFLQTDWGMPTVLTMGNDISLRFCFNYGKIWCVSACYSHPIPTTEHKINYIAYVTRCSTVKRFIGFQTSHSELWMSTKIKHLPHCITASSALWKCCFHERWAFCC